MAQVTYCKSCGAYIPEGQKKCLACGAVVGKTYIENITEAMSPQNDTAFDLRAALLYMKLQEQAMQEKADIDLDALMDKRFFTVKIGGVVSKYYFGDLPKTTLFPMDEIESGRTIDGRIIRGGTCGAKRIIDLKLIER